MDWTADKPGGVTVAEFDLFVERTSDARRYGLIGGEIVLMTNPTETHKQIVSNVGAPLKLAMGARGCRTYIGGMSVQVDRGSDARDKYRPHILVRCGPVEGKTVVIDPVVIVEVLSPSIFQQDRGRKLLCHQRISTLQHIVLVYSDQMRVEHYSRTENSWSVATLTRPDQALNPEAVEFQLTLDKIYFEAPLLAERGHKRAAEASAASILSTASTTASKGRSVEACRAL